MTAISWENQVSGDWTTAADWSSGTVPTLADDVTISDNNAGGYAISITSSAVANSLTFDAVGIHVGGAELLENAGSLTLSGALSVEGGLVVLDRANSIGGGVGLSGFSAVLSVGNAGALGTGTLTASGGELLGTVNETLANFIEVDGEPFSIAAAHGTTLDIGSAGWGLATDNTVPYFGGAGQDGTVVLHVPSILTSGGTGGPGHSEIQSGTVKAGDANIGDLLQDPIVDAGATIDIAGFNVDLFGASGSGTITDSGAAATLTLDRDTFAGTITGPISLSVAGFVTLTGTNTYTGTTTINGGSGLGSASLTLGTGGSIGGGAIDDEGGLIINSNNAVTLNNTISGPGYPDAGRDGNNFDQWRQ